MYSVIDKWIYGVKLSFEIIDIQSPNYTKRGKYISNSYFHLMILPVNLYKFVYIYIQQKVSETPRYLTQITKMSVIDLESM